MPEVKIPEDIAGLPFEKAIAELEELVAKMETGGLSLDKLMEGFERGRLLTEHCRGQLSKLEKKISILSGDDGRDGQWTEFTPSNSRTDDPPF